jgi:hypothetical protein
MNVDRPDSPQPRPHERPEDNSLKQDGKTLTEPARPEPDRLRRVQEDGGHGGGAR